MLKFRFLAFFENKNTYLVTCPNPFQSDQGKTVCLAVLFTFARPPLDLHVREVPKTQTAKVTSETPEK